MYDLLGPDYKELEVTVHDLSIAAIAFGFTLGFGWLTTWEAIKQTLAARNPLRSVYVYLIWGEILVCAAFAFICWLHLTGDIAGSFPFYFSILTFWALQVQFLLQIIINRINVIIPDRRKGELIKWGVAALITAINISVYCIWVPARLQISHRYYEINEIWDRIEKTLYLIVDAILNWYFIRQVRHRLVRQGSKKYDRLVKFNVRIIFLSLAMDCLIIGTMSLKNGFVYMQFHPLGYMVKLNIEMSMASLIRKIARQKNDIQPSAGHYELSYSGGTQSGSRHTRQFSQTGIHIQSPREHPVHTGPGVMVHKQVIVETVAAEGGGNKSDRESQTSEEIKEYADQEDATPLKDTWATHQYHAQVNDGKV